MSRHHKKSTVIAKRLAEKSFQRRFFRTTVVVFAAGLAVTTLLYAHYVLTSTKMSHQKHITQEASTQKPTIIVPHVQSPSSTVAPSPEISSNQSSSATAPQHAVPKKIGKVNSNKSSSAPGNDSSPSGPVCLHNLSIACTSTSWAGYIAPTGIFSAISGNWTVPAPTGNGSSSGDATWVGIGGTTTNDLIQAGTEDTITGGHLSISAFYEILPAAPVSIAHITVNPGDSITAILTQISSGEWNIAITDLTDSESFSQDVAYVSSHSSAEWIEEDPTYGSNQQYTLDTFGSVTFGGASVTVNNTAQTISGSGAISITMINSKGKDEAVPSVIDGSGNAFTVTQN